MTWPHPNLLSLAGSPRNETPQQQQQASRNPEACLPACCPLPTPQARRQPLPLSLPPPPTLPPPHHHTTTTTSPPPPTTAPPSEPSPRVNKPLPARSQLRTVSPARLPPRPLSPVRRRPGTLNHVARRHNTKDSDRAPKSKLSGISLLAKDSRAALL